MCKCVCVSFVMNGDHDDGSDRNNVLVCFQIENAMTHRAENSLNHEMGSCIHGQIKSSRQKFEFTKKKLKLTQWNHFIRVSLTRPSSPSPMTFSSFFKAFDLDRKDLFCYLFHVNSFHDSICFKRIWRGNVQIGWSMEESDTDTYISSINAFNKFTTDN